MNEQKLDSNLRLLAMHRAEVARLEGWIKAKAGQHYYQTGELDFNPYITVVKFVDKPEYNRRDAEAWCEENALHYFIYKRTFQAKAFNDALRDGSLEWLGAELVNDFRIDISKKLNTLLPKAGSAIIYPDINPDLPPVPIEAAPQATGEPQVSGDDEPPDKFAEDAIRRAAQRYVNSLDKHAEQTKSDDEFPDDIPF